MSIKQKIILFIFLIIGTLVQIAPVIRSGLNYPFGIGFWGPSGHDSVWHLSLINHIKDPFNINMPVYSGYKLQNYHPFFDIMISYLSKLTHISTSLWLFQIFPVLSSILLLYLSYQLGSLVAGNFFGGILLLSLNSLANSFGWIISFFKYGNFSGESIFWAMQSPSNQINQPFTLSLIFLLILLVTLYKNPLHTSLTIKESLIVFVMLVLLPVTKAYSAVVGFGIYGLYSLNSFLNIRNYKNLFLLLISFVSAYLLFTVYNPNSSNLFIYRPFWFINSMIDSPDKLFIPKLSSFRDTLLSLPKFDYRLLFVYIFTFTIFIIGNFSWRLLGMFHFFKKRGQLDKTLLLIIIILTIIPTLFIQKGTSWNTIQFLYYALFLSNIFLASFVSSIIFTRFGKFLTFIIFAGYTLAFFGMLPNYTGKIPPAALPYEEISALKFLSVQPTGIVLTYPYDNYSKNNYISTPIPLYAYETTAYVSAYSRQLTYLEDEMNASNSGFDYLSRRNESTKFFKQLDIYQDRGFLLNNNINYIYLTSEQAGKAPLNISQLYLTKIYDTQGVVIYKVQK
jgi:hypothetical protein